MSDAKSEILSRIREALGEPQGKVEVAQAYLQTSTASQAELLEAFSERTTEYRASVYRTSEAELSAKVAEVCRLREAKTLVIPPDLPDVWLPQNVNFIRDNDLTNAELSAADGVLSGCALAVAQTGTFILDGGASQGRRALTLLPDLHLCIVFARQVVGTVPEAVAALQTTATRPLTLISGPSGPRTSN